MAYELVTIGDIQPASAPVGGSSALTLGQRAGALLADVRAQRTGLVVGLVVGAVAAVVYKEIVRR